jgi:hypothetical protein
MKFYVRLISDDEESALIDHFEVDQKMYEDMHDLLELWQESHPKPAPLALEELPSPSVRCDICMAAHKHALSALRALVG